MGWLFSPSWGNREELRRHLVEENGVTVLKSCWVGNNLWAVQEYTYPATHDKAGQVVRYVCLYLCQNGGEREGWGYKDVSEDMGPYQTSCPLAYIEMVEAHEREFGYEPTGYAASWRASVHERKLKADRKLEIGQRICLYGKEYYVYEPLGRGCYTLEMIGTGHHYRMPKRMMKDVEVLA